MGGVIRILVDKIFAVFSIVAVIRAVSGTVYRIELIFVLEESH